MQQIQKVLDANRESIDFILAGAGWQEGKGIVKNCARKKKAAAWKTAASKPTA